MTEAFVSWGYKPTRLCYRVAHSVRLNTSSREHCVQHGRACEAHRPLPPETSVDCIRTPRALPISVTKRCLRLMPRRDQCQADRCASESNNSSMRIAAAQRPIDSIRYMEIMRNQSFLLILMLSVSKAVAGDLPFWDVDFPDSEGWKIGHKQIASDFYVMEWVPRDESVKDWSQMVTYTHEIAEKASFQTLMNAIIVQLQINCPSFTASVLEKSETSVVFRWQDDGCQGYPPQKVIAKYIYEGGGLLGLQYAYYPEKTNSDFALWQERIINAKPAY